MGSRGWALVLLGVIVGCARSVGTSDDVTLDASLLDGATAAPGASSSAAADAQSPRLVPSIEAGESSAASGRSEQPPPWLESYGECGVEMYIDSLNSEDYCINLAELLNHVVSPDDAAGITAPGVNGLLDDATDPDGGSDSGPRCPLIEETVWPCCRGECSCYTPRCGPREDRRPGATDPAAEFITCCYLTDAFHGL